jgi:putative MATE family efflux protein
MAIPISFAIFIPQFNFIVNNIFLGHFSPETLAIAGITGVYYLVFSAIGYGLNNGLQSLIAKRAGENKPDEIGLLFNQGVYISLFVAAIGVAFTWFCLPALFKWLIYDENRSFQAIEFLKIRIWGLPFLYIYQMRNALLVGINQSRLLVAGTVVEALSNVFFDYSLIFGNFGLPALGFNGAAYASIIAEFLGMFVIFLVIQRQGISKRFGLFGNMILDFVYIKEILRFSYPLIFQQAFSIATWEYFFILLEHQGSTALQVSNSMRNVFGIFGSISWAFSATTNSMVSNILGQGLQMVFWKLIKRISFISVSISLFFCLVLNLFPELFLGLFGQNAEFFAAGIPTIRVVSVAMILMSISSIILNAVIATGQSKISLFAEVFSLVLYIAYIYWALEINSFPVYIAWMSEWIYWIFLLLPCLGYLVWGNWRKLKLDGE